MISHRFLAIGIILLLAAIGITAFRDWQVAPFDEGHLYIMVAGEGFDDASNPDIDVSFDDKGQVVIDLESEDENEIVWMFIADTDSFDWNSEGDVVRYDSTNCNPTYDMTGTNENYVIFRVSVSGDERITLLENDPRDETFFRTSIHTPYIGTFVKDYVDAGDDINDFITAAKDANEDELEQLAEEVLPRFFSVGQFGDVVLAPSIPIITVRYNDNEGYRSKYELVMKPGRYSDDRIMATWHGRMQIYPSVDYRNRNLIHIAELIADVLFAVAFFIITTWVVEYASNRKRKRKSHGKWQRQA